MNDDALLLFEIWDGMKDHLLSGSSNEAANALVTAFINQGHDLADLLEAGDECPILERALDTLKEEEDDEEDIGDY